MGHWLRGSIRISRESERGEGSLKEGNAQEKQSEMGSGGSIEEVALKSPTTSQQRKLGILIITMVVQESKGKEEEEENK